MSGCESASSASACVFVSRDCVRALHGMRRMHVSCSLPLPYHECDMML
jgi:hypothetical protein